MAKAGKSPDFYNPSLKAGVNNAVSFGFSPVI